MYKLNIFVFDVFFFFFSWSFTQLGVYTFVNYCNWKLLLRICTKCSSSSKKVELKEGSVNQTLLVLFILNVNDIFTLKIHLWYYLHTTSFCHFSKPFSLIFFLKKTNFPNKKKNGFSKTVFIFYYLQLTRIDLTNYCTNICFLFLFFLWSCKTIICT